MRAKESAYELFAMQTEVNEEGNKGKSKRNFRKLHGLKPILQIRATSFD
jgi:hypothetical protein